ncbi:Ark- serine/threonine protein kinase [Taxawa tesnikishii (nom. ined.)]|nr:Ark- serine/threonine protein kinase [Dothideales sp. JES 119]
MTSPSPPVTLPKLPEIKHRAIWRVPDHNRSSSQPRASPSSQSAANSLKPKNPQRPSFLDTNRSKSQSSTVTLRSPASSRPSLEGHRPSDMDMNDNLTRAKSANSKARPVSAAYVESNLDFLRDQERESASKKRPSLDIRRPSRQPSGENEVAIDDTNIESDTDYLRSVEGGQSAGWSSSRKSSDHKKRTSLPSLGLSGTKVFGSKLGDAFRRFESGGSDKKDKRPDQPLRTPSPQPPGQTEKALLSPISGSEATASPPGNRGSMTADLAETEDLPPEVRRELERRRLEQEERRVAEAAAEHRNRTANGQTVPNRASTIQKRVQSLLDEGRQSPAPRRTAEGYGHYTDNPHPQQQLPLAVSNKGPPPMVARKPVVAAPAANMAYSKPRQQQPMNPPIASIPIPSASAPPAHPRPASRPTHGSQDRHAGAGYLVPATANSKPRGNVGGDNAPASGPRSRGAGPGLAALLARDAEGVAAPGGGHTQDPSADIRTADSVPTDAVGVQEDWEADFSKRYPSLSGIEMVETEIVANAGGGGGPGGRRMLRVKDV